MIGQSVIIAPSGEIVAQAVSLEDEIITARCDLDLGKRYRETIFNFAKHREPEAYRLIVERKGAIPPPEEAEAEPVRAERRSRRMNTTQGECSMSTVIKGGTIVAADRTYEADILIEGETIAAIGENLNGDKTVDAEGAYVMPGGIDPHTHLEMPFMGTTAAETWESGTFAALSGGTTHGRRLRHSRAGRHARRARRMGGARRAARPPPTIRSTCA